MESYIDRRDILLRDIHKDMRGIEIGPYFAPLVPKSAGYRSLSLDVFNKEQLLHNARNEKNIEDEAHARIEDVDLVGGAADIALSSKRRG